MRLFLNKGLQPLAVKSGMQYLFDFLQFVNMVVPKIAAF